MTAILQGDPVHATPRGAAPSLMADWPLVGRSVELAQLRDLLTAPQPRGVVLAGHSGVGKTRLGRECLLLAQRAGMATAQVTATRSAAQLPFAALTPLLPVDALEHGAGDDRVDLLHRSLRRLTEQRDGSRLLLFVDDAHLLDDASATLVHQAATANAVTVLVTVLTGETAPDPIVALWKDRLCDRIEIEGLPSTATAELLAAVLAGAVDPAAAFELAERCQGNALYLHELVLGALDDGSLHEDGGLWRLRGELSPSTRLVELVEARLGRLDDAERAVMELVSYGEPLRCDELAQLCDLAAAEALERRELLTSRIEDGDVVVRLAHPLYGDVVRARTPALRALSIAQSLAEAVEATGLDRSEDVLRVATWRLTVGGGDPGLLLQAAVHARACPDYPLAERLARAAQYAGAGFDAAVLAAQLAGLQGRREEAERELAGLAALATDDAQRGRVAIARADNAGAGTDDERHILDEAAATIRDRKWRDRLEARRLGVLANSCGPRASAEAALPLLADGCEDATDYAWTIRGYGLAREGRLRAALRASARGQDAERDGREPMTWEPWSPTVTQCLALLYWGRFDEAEDLVAAFHRQALDDGCSEAQGAFALLRAHAVADRGRVHTAAAAAREALALNQQLGRTLLVRQGHIACALALALAGQADAAAEQLAALDALELPLVLRDEVDLLQARAWTAAAGGDLRHARHQLEQAAALGEEIGDLVGAASALHGLARLGRAATVCDRLSEVAARIDGDLAPARADHAAALARDDADALDQMSLTFEAMGADLLAAEAAADAAVARRQKGETRRATAATRRVGLLVARCEEPVTPALRGIETRARLTPAERETAVLAAGGRTNKEIASQLYLSTRTVENRLQRVYGKLGISSRSELAEALAPAD